MAIFVVACGLALLSGMLTTSCWCCYSLAGLRHPQHSAELRRGGAGRGLILHLQVRGSPSLLDSMTEWTPLLIGTALEFQEFSHSALKV